MILKKGMINETVKYWQKFINSFYINPVLVEDGNFGNKTEAYTKEYQRDNHLLDDGIVGTMTYNIALAQGLILPEEIKTDLQEIVIDVSHYQPSINFDKIKQAGIKGVIHKATEGLSYKEKEQMFFARRDSCLERGIFWGAYHFIRPYRTDIQDNFMIDFINGKNNDVDITNTLIALDFEDYNVSIAKVEQFVKEIYESIGRYPYLYTGIGLIKGKVRQDSILTNCKLWFAKYSRQLPQIPYPFTDWTLWQHSAEGRILGVLGNVDVNYFKGENLEDVWAN